MDWFKDNLTKVLGVVVTVLGVLQTMITGGAFEGLLDPMAIRWLGIITTLFGAAITGVGFTNTTKERLADSFDAALRAKPGEISTDELLKGKINKVQP